MAAVPRRSRRPDPPALPGRDRRHRAPEQRGDPAGLGQRAGGRRGVRLPARRMAPDRRRRRDRGPAQDRREPGPHGGPAVGAHAQRHAVLPGVRFRRPERAGRGRAPAAARRRVHPQRRDPGRRAADPGRLLPVPGQPRRCSRPSGPRWPRRRPTWRRRRSGGASGSPPSPTCCRRGPRRARRSSTCRSTEGTLQTTRGALALALGLPGQPALRRGLRRRPRVPVGPLADSVDALIASALRGPARPGGRALGGGGGARRHRRGAAPICCRRSTSRATGGRTYATTIPNGANSYNLSLGLDHPDVQRLLPAVRPPRRASIRRRRRRPGARRIRQQVVFQVFSAYYALQTSTRRVRTAEDLIASAQQSSEVALARYKAGVGTRARPAGGAERARAARGRSGWTPGSPGASRWRSWRTTPACSIRKGGAPPLRPRPPTPRRCLPDDASSAARPARRPRCSRPSPPAPRRTRRRRRRCRSRSALAERRAVPFELAATGTVEPIQTVAVQPQVSGPIVRIAFREGQDVKKGQVLFELDPRPFQAALGRPQGLLGRDRARRRTPSRRPSGTPRWRRRSTSPRSRTTPCGPTAAAATATVAASQAAVDQARLNLQYATIRAPIAGRTGSLRVREGNLVRSTDATPLVTINQIQPILVRFAVPAGNLPAIQRYRAQTDRRAGRSRSAAARRARARWRSWTTRWTPPPAPSCSRAASPTPMARSGRASS